MDTIYLFTSELCMHCPTEKNYLLEMGITFKEVDVYSQEFKSLEDNLLRNGIVLRHVPAIVRENDRGMELVTRQSL